MTLSDSSSMPFGKYQGKPMGSVPAKYLLWLFNNGCQHAEVKAYIQDRIQAIRNEAGLTIR